MNIDKANLVAKFNEAPFFTPATINGVGEYKFSYDIKYTNDEELLGAKAILINEIINAVVDNAISNTICVSGDYVAMNSGDHHDSISDGSGMVTNVAGTLITSSASTNTKPVIIANNIDTPKQIDSTKLSIVDVVFDNNSYENGVLSVSGKVLYTY